MATLSYSRRDPSPGAEISLMDRLSVQAFLNLEWWHRPRPGASGAAEN